jgi:hypothetical protein
MDIEIETIIDGQPFVWYAGGEFAWGKGAPLCRLAKDPLLPRLGRDGYRIVDLPAGCAELTAARVAELFNCGTNTLETYHQRIDDAGHEKLIEKTRELRFADLRTEPQTFTSLFGGMLGVRLSEILPALGRDRVQLRINRPGSTDYNPPHRDAALSIYRNSLNVWIPIAGVDARTSLPIVPGSHRIAEQECWQTEAGRAVIAGRRYQVPAIARLREGRLEMIRASVVFGQALLFTPCLIHGLAVNNSGTRTRMALELRLEVMQ